MSSPPRNNGATDGKPDEVKNMEDLIRSYEEELKDYRDDIQRLLRKGGDSFALSIKNSIAVHTSDTGEELLSEKADEPKRLVQLLLLAYAGSTKTQDVFAQVLFDLVNKAKASSHDMLFNSAIGNEILKSLIQCATVDDPKTKKTANQALRKLALNVEKLLQVARDLRDDDIEYWVALMLFQATISKFDESSSHVLYTYDSPHPYPSNANHVTHVQVPGAKTVVVRFDQRSHTADTNDVVGFYKDKACAEKDMLVNQYEGGGGNKFSGVEMAKAIFQTDCDDFYLNLKSDDSMEGWGFKIYVSASFEEPEGGAEANRMKIVENGGLSLLKRYIDTAALDGARRFAGFALANLTMSEACKKAILAEAGPQFFVGFPMDLVSQRVAALCLSELVENEENQLGLLRSPDFPHTLQVLKHMTRSYDGLCRYLSTKTLQLLASPDDAAARAALLAGGLLETFFRALRTEADRNIKQKALLGIFSLSQRQEQLLAYRTRELPAAAPPDNMDFVFNNRGPVDAGPAVLRVQCPLDGGRTYAEVELVTGGELRVGFATEAYFSPRTVPLGEVEGSIALAGPDVRIIKGGKAPDHPTLPVKWGKGTVLGISFNYGDEDPSISFSVDGAAVAGLEANLASVLGSKDKDGDGKEEEEEGGKPDKENEKKKIRVPLYLTLELGNAESCKINLGQEPFKSPLAKGFKPLFQAAEEAETLKLLKKAPSLRRASSHATMEHKTEGAVEEKKGEEEDGETKKEKSEKEKSSDMPFAQAEQTGPKMGSVLLYDKTTNKIRAPTSDDQCTELLVAQAAAPAAQRSQALSYVAFLRALGIEEGFFGAPLLEESQHPFEEGARIDRHIRRAGATALRVAFTDKCALNPHAVDSLTFYRDAERTDVIQTYTGMDKVFKDLEIPGDQFYYSFAAGLNDKAMWGYAFTVTPVYGLSLADPEMAVKRRGAENLEQGTSTLTLSSDDDDCLEVWFERAGGDDAAPLELEGPVAVLPAGVEAGAAGRAIWAPESFSGADAQGSTTLPGLGGPARLLVPEPECVVRFASPADAAKLEVCFRPVADPFNTKQNRSGAQVVQSEHPYGARAAAAAAAAAAGAGPTDEAGTPVSPPAAAAPSPHLVDREIRLEGAEAIGVAFDPRCSTRAEDKLEILRKDEASGKWVPATLEVDGGGGGEGEEPAPLRWAGSHETGEGRDFPGVDGRPDLFLRGNHFRVRFTVAAENMDRESTLWGFRLVAYPLGDIFEELCESKKTVVVESEHTPYPIMQELVLPVALPSGATKWFLAFDPRSQTLGEDDRVELYLDPPTQEEAAEETTEGEAMGTLFGFGEKKAEFKPPAPVATFHGGYRGEGGRWPSLFGRPHAVDCAAHGKAWLRFRTGEAARSYRLFGFRAVAYTARELVRVHNLTATEKLRLEVLDADAATLEDLVALARSRDAETRVFAAAALCKLSFVPQYTAALCEPAMLEAVLGLLGDKDSQVKQISTRLVANLVSEQTKLQLAQSGIMILMLDLLGPNLKQDAMLESISLALARFCGMEGQKKQKEEGKVASSGKADSFLSLTQIIITGCTNGDAFGSATEDVTFAATSALHKLTLQDNEFTLSGRSQEKFSELLALLRDGGARSGGLTQKLLRIVTLLLKNEDNTMALLNAPDTADSLTAVLSNTVSDDAHVQAAALTALKTLVAKQESTGGAGELRNLGVAFSMRAKYLEDVEKARGAARAAKQKAAEERLAREAAAKRKAKQQQAGGGGGGGAGLPGGGGAASPDPLSRQSSRGEALSQGFEDEQDEDAAAAAGEGQVEQPKYLSPPSWESELVTAPVQRVQQKDMGQFGKKTRRRKKKKTPSNQPKRTGFLARAFGRGGDDNQPSENPLSEDEYEEVPARGGGFRGGRPPQEGPPFQQLFRNSVRLCEGMELIATFLHPACRGQELTLACWLYQESIATKDALLLSLGEKAGEKVQLVITKDSQLRLSVPVKLPKGRGATPSPEKRATYKMLTPANMIQTKEWTHLVVSVGPNRQTLYLNGTELTWETIQDEENKEEKGRFLVDIQPLLEKTEGALGVGRPLPGISKKPPFPCYIEDLRAFPRTLSSEEIVGVWRSSKPIHLDCTRQLSSASTDMVRPMIARLHHLNEGIKGLAKLSQDDDDEDPDKDARQGLNALRRGVLEALVLVCDDDAVAAQLARRRGAAEGAAEGPLLQVAMDTTRSSLDELNAYLRKNEDALDKKSKMKTLESKHPYDNNTDTFDKVVMEGAKALKVYFDPRTSTESNWDYVELYKDEGRTQKHGEAKYTGGRDNSVKNYPTLARPLILKDTSELYVRFYADGSNNDWGYKLFVEAVDDEFALAEELPNVKFETEHNHKQDVNLTEKVKFEGAEYIKVMFHSDTSTRKGDGVVRLYRDEAFAEPLGDPEGYSGEKDAEDANWPTPFSPLILQADELWLNFRTGSVDHRQWGFKVVMCPHDPDAEGEGSLPGVSVLRPATALFSLAAETFFSAAAGAQNADADAQREMQQVITGQGAEGLMALVQLLELDKADEKMSAAVNGALFNMASNLNMFNNMFDNIMGGSGKVINVTTQRWLMTMFAMLTSEKEWVTSAFISDESVHFPKAEQSFNREIAVPLASAVELTWDYKTDMMPEGQLVIESGDVRKELKGDFSELPPHIDLPSGRVNITYTEGEGNTFGYRFYLNPVFDQRFQFAGLTKGPEMIRAKMDEKLTLMVNALESEDPETQLYGSRTLANMMFIAKAKGVRSGRADQIMLKCQKPLLDLVNKELDVSALKFKVKYQERKKQFPTVRASNLLLQPEELPYGKKIYYEMRLKSKGQINVGWVLKSGGFEKGYPNNGVGDNLHSFGITPFGQKAHNDEYTQYSSKEWQANEGDVIGCYLNYEAREMMFSLNGRLLDKAPAFKEQAVPEPSRQAQEEQETEIKAEEDEAGEVKSDESKTGDAVATQKVAQISWDQGLYPAASFDPLQSASFNFGQEEFAFQPQAGYISVFEAKKGPFPEDGSGPDKANWKALFWQVYDNNQDADAMQKGWAAADGHEKIKILFSEDDVKAEFERLQANHLRQVARALTAMPLTDNKLFKLTAKLAAHSDHTTAKWALQALNRAVRESPEVARRALREQALVPLVKGCMTMMPRAIDFEEAVNAFCASTHLPIFIEGAKRYLQASQAEPPLDKAMFESQHPYKDGETTYYDLSLPGTRVIKIMFDSRSKTEKDADFVTIYKKDPRQAAEGSVDGEGRIGESVSLSLDKQHASTILFY